MGNINIGDINSIAQRMSKIYAGDDYGIARQGQKVYIGDDYGIARQAYSAFDPSILPGSTSRSITLVYGSYHTATLLTIPYSKVVEARNAGYSYLSYNWSASYRISSPGGYGNCALNYGASKRNDVGSIEGSDWYKSHGPGYPSSGSSSTNGSYSIPLSSISTNVYFFLTGWASNGDSATFGISNVRFT